MQQYVAENAVLFKLVFRQAEGEMGRINGHVELLQDVRQSAQVIFVAVREDNRRDLFTKLFQNIEIGNRNIDAVDALFRKAHARVDDEHFVTKAQQRAIHPKLANAAEGNDFEDV